MTALLEAPRTRVPAPPAAAPPSRVRRVAGWLRSHRAGLAYLVPLLVVTAAARLVNLGGSPQRVDDEGTYTAQAYAVEKLGEMAHYTYWYDHPPLGWLQIAGWTWLSGGFARYDIAVLAGREAMVVAAVASAGLLWMLGRRLGLGRPAAAVAVLVFALSPLAVQFTRTVYLDNVATPWVLVAFVLALSRRGQLLAFAGSAACFAVAVLSKETYLLLLPILVWQLWRSSHPRTRRYTLSVAGSLLVLIGVGYVLFALVKGEVLPGSDRVSLWEGIEFQLLTRDSSGSIWDPSSQAGRSVGAWLNLDAVLLLAGLGAALGGLAVRRLRPYAAAYLLLIATLFKPGYLPVPFVIAMVPFAALLVAGVLETALRRAHRGGRRLDRGNLLAATAAVTAVALVATAAPLWFGQLRGLWLSDLDRPLRQAQTWVTDNVDDGEQVLVDDAAWVDLVRAGLPRRDVVWFYKADTDPDVSDLAPNGWADYEYAMVTEGMRQSAGTSATLDAALRSSVTVASFGQGDETVDVVRILPGGTDAFYAADYSDDQSRTAAGRALLENPRLELSDAAADQLRRGLVDSRAVSLLALLAGEHRITVADFPVVAGEEDSPLPRRTIDISAVGGQPVSGPRAAALAATARDQVGPYLPRSVAVDDDLLVVEYGIAGPEYLLPEPPTEPTE